MKLVLSDQRCKSCGVKLTEYEATEKKSHCMECYKELNRLEKNRK